MEATTSPEKPASDLATPASATNSSHPDSDNGISYDDGITYSGFRVKIELVDGQMRELNLKLLRLPKKATLEDMRQALLDSPVASSELDVFFPKWTYTMYLTRSDENDEIIHDVNSDAVLQKMLEDECKHPGTLAVKVEQCKNSKYSRFRELHNSRRHEADSNVYCARTGMDMSRRPNIKSRSVTQAVRPTGAVCNRSQRCMDYIVDPTQYCYGLYLPACQAPQNPPSATLISSMMPPQLTPVCVNVSNACPGSGCDPVFTADCDHGLTMIPTYSPYVVPAAMYHQGSQYFPYYTNNYCPQTYYDPGAVHQ